MARATLKWLLRASAAALVLTLLTLLGLRFANRASNVSPGARTVGTVSDAGCDGQGERAVQAYYLLSHMDPTDGSIDSQVTICITADALLALNDKAHGKVFRKTGHSISVRKAFRRSAITVDLGGNTRGTPVERIPLEALTFRGPTTGSTISDQYQLSPETFIATGDPRDFPLDSYSANLGLTLRLPGAVHFHGRSALAPTYQASSSPDLVGYTLSSSSVAPDTFDVAITRDAATEIFAIALASAPLILIAALLGLALARTERTTGGELVLGAGAVLLAILPIRTVLVPEDVSGLTLVDLALGTEVGLLVALTAWTASNILTQNPRGRAAGQGGTVSDVDKAQDLSGSGER